VPRNRAPSPQTTRVIRALAADPSRWRYGYDLGAETGLKAGSLYPILVRLADRGLLEAAWEEPAPQGRPPRHLYRLTADGQELAGAITEPGPAHSSRPQGQGRMVGRPQPGHA
jgi:DNA-binding PadR family transcriptional regulator